MISNLSLHNRIIELIIATNSISSFNYINTNPKTSLRKSVQKSFKRYNDRENGFTFDYRAKRNQSAKRMETKGIDDHLGPQPFRYSVRDRGLDKEKVETYHSIEDRKIMKEYLSKSHIKFTDPSLKVNDYHTSKVDVTDREKSTNQSMIQGIK